MAKKKRLTKKNTEDQTEYEEKKEQPSWFEEVRHETKQSIFIITSFLFGLIFLLAILGRAGTAGTYVARSLLFLFGQAEFIIPLFFFLVSVSLFFYFRPRFLAPTLLGGLLFLASVLGGIEIVFGEKTAGYAGFLVAAPVLKLFDFWASFIVMAALFVVSILLMLNTSFIRVTKIKKDDGEGDTEITLRGFSLLKNALQLIMRKKKNDYTSISVVPETTPRQFGETHEEGESKEAVHFQSNDEETNGFTGALKNMTTSRRRLARDFKMPPLDLLEDDRGKPSSGDIKANANIIKRTFKNFGIDVEMAEVNIGPSITQYTLRPAEGVKLAKITGLHNDLALALAAHPIRIEAPIPGRSLVGIEIPNKVVALVGIRSLLSDEMFQRSPHSLTLTLGRDVSGKAVYTALEKMPHLLIAGATGSGKSVAIHGLMMSLLYKNGPDNLRFMLVDPKRVELSIYGDIPHLLAPVITDAKKTILGLRWAVSEMERRYEMLSSVGARDAHSYQVTREALKNPMPYIVIIIDELADIMATYPRELEASIVRLAQMSRAVGIHLVVSTQRPSVEVITGLIKANITSRIAFQVASQVDSRTILDMAGAEKLLGNGDMLFLAGDTTKPRRIQGSFVSEQEVRKVAQFLEDQYAGYENSSVTIETEDMENKKSIFDDVAMKDDKEDELYGDARTIVLEAKKASASYLQRRLRIGYARAARLLDILEDRGVIGPGEGAKPREVYGASSEEDMPSDTLRSGKEPDDEFFKTMQ